MTDQRIGCTLILVPTTTNPTQEVTMLSLATIVTSPAGAEVPMNVGDTLTDEFGTAGFELAEGGRFHAMAQVSKGRSLFVERTVSFATSDEAYDHALAMLAEAGQA